MVSLTKRNLLISCRLLQNNRNPGGIKPIAVIASIDQCWCRGSFLDVVSIFGISPIQQCPTRLLMRSLPLGFSGVMEGELGIMLRNKYSENQWHLGFIKEFPLWRETLAILMISWIAVLKLEKNVYKLIDNRNKERKLKGVAKICHWSKLHSSVRPLTMLLSNASNYINATYEEEQATVVWIHINCTISS